MLTLAGIITYSISAMTDWKEGRNASEKLKSVYVAQKSYLADHPTETYTGLSESDLIPYLPGSPGAMPTQESMEGQALTLKFQVMPPVYATGDTPYDPSDSTEDGLWDVGGL